jgi:hypothetical protein
MPHENRWLSHIAIVAAVTLTLAAAQADSGHPPSSPAVFGVFVGSSPCDDSIRPILQIPGDVDAHLIEWTVTLFKHPTTGAPAGYHVQYKYGLTVPNRPGLGPVARTEERRGTWRLAKGTRTDPEGGVYELNGAVSLYRVSDNVLHLLNGDRSLMLGTSGWSYTLNRSDASEPRVDPLADAGGPDGSRSVSPLSTGPTVFGVFEGRSPCQGIARELKIPVRPGCAKVKWRVTLYQDPGTRRPTTYKIDSTLHRSGPREGQWTIVRGAEMAPSAVAYRLGPAGTEAALILMKGDDNVLFFMDQNHRPLTAHAEFSYTLNRRQH